jgi:hypothetical protein
LVNGASLSKWSDEDLQQIPAMLATLDFDADYVFALQSERAVINSVFDEILSKSNSDLVKFSDAAGLGQSFLSASLYPRGWIRLSQVKMNQFFDQASERGLQLAKVLPEDPILQTKGITIGKLPYLLYAIVTPVLDQATTVYAHANDFRDQVLLACALERFRRKNGAYPEKLDALTPDFLTSVPLDPIDGLPMRYRRADDGGFKIWSIGADRIDEGGKLEEGKSSRSQPDWVLQVPGKP